MRTLHVDEITQAIARAVVDANTHLPEDVLRALASALERETSPRGRRFLQVIIENADLAATEGLALCQDTGMVVVDLEVGQEVLLVGGDLMEAVNRGIKQGYELGFFRRSVVKDPFSRINTGDNTPAILHTSIIPGEGVRMRVLPKGAGSENMGRVGMLKPSQGLDGVKDFVLQAVWEAGGNPCPPLIVGVGVGGNMEKAALLSKKALLRPLDQRHSHAEMADLENQLRERINELGIGPQGLGGDTTALAVNIETYPTHIACLPVAVNLGCHSTRRVCVEL
ncbi:MAG TPA: fumarate hydratase [Syntrophomonadaceae bacterium]|nr:fumarate hydratase [Syntrophomonadaceae bacterium]